jgi:translation initiation factor 1
VNDRRLVYSSDTGRVDNRDERPAAKSKAPVRAPALPADGVVRIFREKAHRGGKTVTVIRGLPQNDLESRALELKRLCGAGGTVREGAIEIQGDHRERVAERLRSAGYQVKLAGG